VKDNAPEKGGSLKKLRGQTGFKLQAVFNRVESFQTIWRPDFLFNGRQKCCQEKKDTFLHLGVFFFRYRNYTENITDILSKKELFADVSCKMFVCELFRIKG
jgi:hypothetical protein